MFPRLKVWISKIGNSWWSHWSGIVINQQSVHLALIQNLGICEFVAPSACFQCSRDSSEQSPDDTTPVATNVMVKLERIICTFAQHSQPLVTLLPQSSNSCLVASPSPHSSSSWVCFALTEIHSTRLFFGWHTTRWRLGEELGFAD